MLDRLLHFDADRLSLEELVELAGFGRQFRAEFEALDVEVPEWVDVQIKSLRREVRARAADALEKRLREKKARLEGLKPAEQRRTELQREIEELEAKLAK